LFAHDFELVEGGAKYKCLPCTWAAKRVNANADDVTFYSNKSDAFVSHFGLKPRATKRKRASRCAAEIQTTPG
jgi:hypothetical protein